jgi:hypothetical protein
MEKLAWTASVDADRIGAATTGGAVDLLVDMRSYPRARGRLTHGDVGTRRDDGGR